MKLINIKKIYHNKNNEVVALKGISLEFNENGIIMILGSSGCGKTTLLNIMSGRDNNYEGSVEDVPNFDYLTQEFNLFEEMSVLENLLLINRDKGIIKKYLNMFHMDIHQNKKVKLLSNGQKKRVQFIRALLHKPGLLLCDEPTAALDHENTEMLMKELVKLSKDIQIIFVTHDIALSEKYADRVIKMNQGSIISDEIIKKNSDFNIGEKINKKSFRDTLFLVLSELKSRWCDTVFKLLLSILSIVMLFSLFTFYQDVTYQYNYNESFKRGDNLIVSLPNESVTYSYQNPIIGDYDNNHDLDFYYHINQLYYAKDVEKVIKENKDIIAVEAYWSKQYLVNGDNYGLMVDVFGSFDYQNEFGIRKEVDEPYYPSMYVYSDEFLNGKSKESQAALLYGNVQFDEARKDHSYRGNMLACYDLVNSANLPLLAGKMATEEDEVILSKNLANKIMENEAYLSFEEMIGKKIYIGLCGRKNSRFGKEGLLEETNIVDLIEVKISGISSVESDYQLMIFFNNGFSNNLPIRYFVENDKRLFFNYVRFLVEPGSDTEAIANNINKSFNYSDQSIIKFEGRGLNQISTYYKSPKNFLIYFVSITLIFMFMFVIHYLFKRKVMNKENGILTRYGYSLVLERIIHISIIGVVAIIFSLLFAYQFCEFINVFAKKYQYEMLISYNPIRILIISVMFMIYLFILENIILKKKEV